VEERRRGGREGWTLREAKQGEEVRQEKREEIG
jgi:hypothetical protein